MAIDHNVSLDREQLRAALEELRRSTTIELGADHNSGDTIRRLLARELLLLRQTIAYAATHVPYYEELFRRQHITVDDFQKAADLRHLPVLEKSTIASNLEAFLSQQVAITSIACTSGTSGLRLPRFTSDEEEEACDLLNQIDFSAQRPNQTTNGKKDILLRVFPAMRRYSRPNRQPRNLQVVVTLNWDYPKYYTRCDFFDFVIRQLFEPFPVPGTAGRITVVHVTPPFVIRMLTEDLKARSLACRDTKVHTIVCSGGLLTNRIRKLIQDEWGAHPVSVYSMTEANGTAQECPAHPYRYHFNAAVYLEVVDPDTHAPVPVGQEGILLVTSLYPFQQAQPLLRYNTDDVVTNWGNHCDCGAIAPTVEFRGRRIHCLDLGDVVPSGCRNQYVACADIHNLLEDLPEVPSLFYPRFLVERLPGNGTTVIKLTAEAQHITGASMARQLTRRLLAGLQARYSAWDSLIKARKLAWEVEWRNRGEMETFFRLTPPS